MNFIIYIWNTGTVSQTEEILFMAKEEKEMKGSEMEWYFCRGAV